MTIVKMLIILYYMDGTVGQLEHPQSFETMEACSAIAERAMAPMQQLFDADGITVLCYDQTETQGERL